MRILISHISTLLCLFTLAAAIFALPGDLDPGFDSDGKTLTPVGVDDYARGVAIQPDGKIVAAGYSSDGTTPANFDISLVRYNPDGSLDATFGTGGKVYLSGESGSQRAHAVLILPDGKILAVGSDNAQLAVFRFNSNGSVDTSFGTNGRVVHVIGVGSAGNDAILQSDGKIVISGYVFFAGFSRQLTVFRLNADGSFDTSFNSIGYTAAAFGGTEAFGVALQNDGKIIAAGRDTTDNHGYWGRFGTDGVLEGGISNLIRSDVQFNDVAIQADGKPVFAGYVRVLGTGQTRFGITRFNSDKTLDIFFGNGGVNVVHWMDATSTHHRAYSLFIQQSGRIVVGGHARFGGGNFGLVRFNAHGFLDQGFGNGGKVVTAFNGNDEITALAQQTDGRIVAVGFGIVGPGNDYAIARYDGSDSNTMPTRAPFDFDGDGRSDVSVFRPSTGEWFIFNSGSSSVTIKTFGITDDVPVPADYDADARTDFAIRRPFSSSGGGWWYLLSNGNGFAQQYPYAPGGDYARPGDFTGDGGADIVTYNSSNGLWARHNFTNGQDSSLTFGIAGDKPVLGDFDGDTKVDPAIYRPSTGEWWYAASSLSGAHRAARWGIAEDIPSPGDYDGDHKTDFAVYRPSEGAWYIYNSSNGTYIILHFGLPSDKPVPADYDGDGKADIAVFRPSTGVWYLMRSTSGFGAMQFGVSTDIPTPNVYVP